jgi:hypothetical protein
MKNKLIAFKATEDEKQALESRAQEKGMHISAYIRHAVFQQKEVVEFHQALLYLALYEGGPLQQITLLDVNFMLRSFILNRATLNENQRKFIDLAISSLHRTRIELESGADESDFTVGVNDVLHSIWENFLNPNDPEL